MKFQEYVDQGSSLAFRIYGETVFESPEIAICYDRQSGVLLKHGKPDDVERWRENAVARYCEAGYHWNPDDLVLLKGTFPVHELNRVVGDFGYAKTFHERLEEEREGRAHD